ncbi:MAG TPA: CmcJ/NvfI family oxidoreductase [Candidatus Binataceae bacterium]|nr:CmcJ/NvfI family oxidoreductase [Candidatus Binataceae bacterium]
MRIALDALDHVDALLNYATGRRGAREAVPIYDGRAAERDFSLDQQGFMLCRRETAVTDFYDAAQVRSIYYPEVEQLLREATGAVKVVAFEHDVRCLAMARRGEGGAREPVRVVHDDYTEKSAPERVRLYLPGEADGLLKNRYAVINVWRPIKGPVRDTPLAVCDAQSIADGDIVPTEEGVKHEVYLFNFSRRHRWFYFSAMERDEALLLKCFDSSRDGRARLTAHTAFDDPTAPAATRERESIEVRALAFFAPAA